MIHPSHGRCICLRTNQRLEIAWWPREVPGTEPVEMDALVFSKSIGAGRIVVCQLPLGDWRTDRAVDSCFRMRSTICLPGPNRRCGRASAVNPACGGA